MSNAETTANGFGSCLRELREKSGLTQEDLAEMVGVSRPTITQWETGWSVPKLKRLYDLADALACDPSDFFDSVAEPARTRNVVGVETVEIPVSTVRHWLYLARYILSETERLDIFARGMIAVGSTHALVAYEKAHDAWTQSQRLCNEIARYLPMPVDAESREVES